MPEAFLRPLYPQEVREKDLITVTAGLARFLRREGYWPKMSELATYLKADRGGTVDCCRALIEGRLVAREARKSGLSRYKLTPRGWDVIGAKPIEPWRRPPGRGVLRQAVTSAALKIIEMEQYVRRADRYGDNEASGVD